MLSQQLNGSDGESWHAFHQAYDPGTRKSPCSGASCQRHRAVPLMKDAIEQRCVPVGVFKPLLKNGQMDSESNVVWHDAEVLGCFYQELGYSWD